VPSPSLGTNKGACGQNHQTGAIIFFKINKKKGRFKKKVTKADKSCFLN